MKGASTSRWGRCLRAPLRALCSVRDLYIKGMNGCAGRIQYGAAAVPVAGYPSFSDFSEGYRFNRSGRSSSSEEDLRELIRAASVGAGSGSMRATPGPRWRSQSVVVGRIDEEEEACEFEEDVVVGSDLLYPRSRSYAAAGVRVRRFA